MGRREHGIIHCLGIRNNPKRHVARLLDTDDLARRGFVLDHAEDRQAAATVRVRLFTDAQLVEITGLRRDRVRGAWTVLADSNTGP